MHPYYSLNRVEILRDEMANAKYSVITYPYACGQIRIMLTKPDIASPGAPPGHGHIVRELDTYKAETASRCVMELSEAVEPEQWCIEQERDWNCEQSGLGPLPGDRIRLDETQESNPYRRCNEQKFRSGAPQAFPILHSGHIL